MPCFLLFRDAAGWLPSAKEMRRRGFRVSAAALAEPAADPQEQGPSLAAESVAEYGQALPAAPAGTGAQGRD